jgi:RNA polymerase sigma-70 factor (ECF subfamily)
MTPGPADDATLWARARAGDGRAFGELFDRHHDRVFRAALRALDAADAEDAVAATYLELWRLRERARLVDGSLLPWLLATVHNVARNLARSRRRYRAFLARIPADDAVRSPEELTVAEFEAFERGRRAASLLAQLSRADSQVLTLAGVDELSIPQLAATLGISVDAAKQRLSRARRRARALDDARSGREAAEGVAP